MGLFGKGFSAQKGLDFLLGGYGGLDRRRAIDTQEKYQSQIDANGTPQEQIAYAFAPEKLGEAYASRFGARNVGAGDLLINGPDGRPIYNPKTFVANDTIYNTAANGGAPSQVGTVAPSFADQTARIKTDQFGTMAPKVMKVRNADGTESLVQVGGGSQDQQPVSAPPPPFNGSAQGSLAQRNNNPGNLRPDGSQWQGMTGQNGGFVQFDTPENGQRAARINLANQAKLHGINTLSGLISKYAPATDGNNPQSYIATVARQTGLDPNQPIDLTDPAVQDKILPAMFAVEGGGTPSPQAQAPVAPPRRASSSNVLYTSKPNEGGAGGSLSPEAIRSGAAYYKATGSLPTLGMGKQAAADRAAILNAAAGDGSANIAGNQADFKANSSTLAQLSKQRGAVAGYEKTVQDNLGIVDDLIGRGSGSFGAPILNRVQQHARKEYAGDPDVTAYETALQTVSSEYAKVMSGGMGNAPVSDSARQHARELLNPYLTADQVRANIAVMRQEMANRIDGMDSEIENIRSHIGGQAPVAPPRKASGGANGYTPEQVAAHQLLKKQDPSWGSAQGFQRIPRTKAEYDRIKPGERYLDTDGVVKEKR